MLKRLRLALFMVLLPIAAFAQDAKRPAFIPPTDWAKIKNLVDVAHVQWHPYQKTLALKHDGTPYRVLFLPPWLGDDYQVTAQQLLKHELEDAGARYTVLAADFSVEAQARAIETAVATHSYDAIIIQPIDPEAVNAVVEKAAAAGIDVYNYVVRVPSNKIAAYAGYHPAAVDTTGQVGAKFVQLAKAAGATHEHPYRVLELWGIRSQPNSFDRHDGFMMGIGHSPIVQVIESADTRGEPQAEIKAIQDAFARYPDIKGIYPQWGDAGGFIEGLRSVGRLVPQSDPKHVVVIINDIDRSMLKALRAGFFDYTISNNPWQQIDVIVKQLLWHTVLKQPLNEGDANSGNVKLPKIVLVPMPLLSRQTIDTPAAQLWGGTVTFTDMPFGKWQEWPVLDTSKIGLPTPTLRDRKRLLGY